jgi:AcrR family transcriptional regulator
MLSAFHPTKRLLVEATSQFLETKSPSEVLAEDVLEKSGVSKGSLYHHFEDLQDLIETAQVFRYSMWIDASIEYITRHVLNSQTKEELRTALKNLTILTQSDERKSARAERALALAAAYDSPRMAKQMGNETQRLTDSLTDIIEELKNKELIKPTINAKTAANFIQAYTLGKIVNDYSPTAVTETEWVDLIMDIVDHTFMQG